MYVDSMEFPALEAVFASSGNQRYHSNRVMTRATRSMRKGNTANNEVIIRLQNADSPVSDLSMPTMADAGAGGEEADRVAEILENDDEEQAAERIWEDPHIEKTYVNGKPAWKCLWCYDSPGKHQGKAFLGGWNATKAIYHLNRVRGYDIRGCDSYNKFSSDDKKFYRELLDNVVRKREMKAKKASALENMVEERVREGTNKYAESRRGHKHSSLSSLPGKATAQLIDNTSASSSPSLLQAKKLDGALSTGRKATSTQMRLIDSPDPNAELKLTYAVGDMIHCNGLPWSIVEDPKFRNVIKLAKFVSTKYKLPSRREVGGTLLKVNYEQHKEQLKERLAKQADVFGLCVFSDGATVKRMPLINILCSGKFDVCLIVFCESNLKN